MKIKLAVVALLALFALASVAIWQSRQAAAHRAEAEALRNQVNEKAQQLEDTKATKSWLMAQRSELMQQTAAYASNAAAKAPAPGTNSPAGPNQPTSAAGDKPNTEKGLFGKFLSKMIDDPETKQFLRDQQQTTIGQLYAPLIKSMDLSQEQADKFKSMLLDNTMKSTERASSLLNNGDASADRTQALTALEAEHKSFEDQMKEFLGDDRYAQYKDYQATVADRMQLNQFRQQSASGDRSISDDQTEQLLRIIREERQNVGAAGYASLGSPDLAGSGTLPTADQADKMLASQEYINQRVQERAKALLTPEQLDALARFQTNQLQTMRLGMSMARKMFQ